MKFLYRGFVLPLEFLCDAVAPMGHLEPPTNLRMAARHPSRGRSKQKMLDVIMLAIGLGFFALAVGYTYACNRL